LSLRDRRRRIAWKTAAFVGFFVWYFRFAPRSIVENDARTSYPSQWPLPLIVLAFYVGSVFIDLDAPPDEQ
jgi:hypothetical protein